MGVSARENPFRVERLHGVRYWEPGLTLDALADRAETQQWRCALVGGHGQGKTTLMLELGEHLAARGLPVQSAQVGDESHWENNVSPDPATIYLLDGAERLSPTAWLAFRWRMRAAKGMIITAHAPGRLPTLHTCRSTPETVSHLLRALEPPDLDALLARSSMLHLQHAGDCRVILFALYDEFAGRGVKGCTMAAEEKPPME